LLYHVIARGNRQQATFLTHLDYETYLRLLAKYRRRYGVRLYAYCLMPNHVHLLVRTSEPPLATFMQGLQQTYTQRFNRSHGTAGHLFQGRYKAILCDRDEYLATLVRYIHLNPVRARLVDDPGAYPYSGHRAYLTDAETDLIDPGFVLTVLGGRSAYRRFVRAGITDGQRSGNLESFPDGVELSRRRDPATAQRTGRVPSREVDVAAAELARRLSLDPGALRSRDRNRLAVSARAAVSFVLVRRRGYRVADVAAALGRDASTISTRVWRLADRLPTDPDLALTVSRLDH
jgi:REP element-mobilizing transposase RayT